AGTAPAAVTRLCQATADELGVAGGEPLTVSTDRGAITLPLAITAMPERVVWLPTNSAGSAVHRDLNADSGDVVRLSRAQPSGDYFLETATKTGPEAAIPQELS
ncbi:MAG: molybdopterin dinucleotide binding domain-containing protein, partial [Mycobacteriales bacterium]